VPRGNGEEEMNVAPMLAWVRKRAQHGPQHCAASKNPHGRASRFGADLIEMTQPSEARRVMRHILESAEAVLMFVRAERERAP
jgi:hypothetical protein